jgi:hypothetical protein
LTNTGGALGYICAVAPENVEEMVLQRRASLKKEHEERIETVL